MIMQPWYEITAKNAQRLKNTKGGRASFKEHLPRLSDRKQQNKERMVLWMPASSSIQNQTKKDRKC